MPSWIVKAIAQRGIAALPNPHYWNELFQKRVTHSLELTDEAFETGLQNCRTHLEHLRRYGGSAKSSFSVFELGTGWFAVVPIGLFLCGAREIWTWDIAPHLQRDRLQVTIRRFLELEQRSGQEPDFRAQPERRTRLREVMARCEPGGLTPAKLLELLGIHYCIGNAGKSGLPAQSVDLILSNVVLEYVSPEGLYEILREFRRITTPGAVMSHSIDLSDQYAAFDSRITGFNFLRFSDSLWRWLNNPIIPLNRCRINDYRRAFNESGFQIVEEKNQRGDPAELARTPLAARFHGYSIEDLLVTFTWLIAT